MFYTAQNVALAIRNEIKHGNAKFEVQIQNRVVQFKGSLLFQNKFRGSHQVLHFVQCNEILSLTIKKSFTVF